MRKNRIRILSMVVFSLCLPFSLFAQIDKDMKEFDDFVKQLRRPDVLLLAEIFAAREKNTIGISSAALADQIDGAVFCPTFDELEDTLRAIAAPGDIVLTVGAGNVYKIGEDILRGKR